MRPHIIGIAGPSSSGKTELARHLVQDLPGTAIVSLDSYYRGRQELPFEEREKLNFDHPAALEWELLQEHLRAIAEGRAFEEPVYSFARHTREFGGPPAPPAGGRRRPARAGPRFPPPPATPASPRPGASSPPGF